jgi:hypothetical protein
MDFFGAQEHARRQSRRLVWLFLLAVLAMVVALDLVVLGVLELGTDPRHAASGGPLERHAGALVATTVATLAVVGIASLYRIGRLRSGGAAVARPRLSAGGGIVAISDPANGRVLLHDGDTLALRRVIETGGAPFDIRLVSLTGERH